MKYLKNKKGFTLVELLAVIVVLAIVMGLAVVGITSVLDSTRKSAFAADAKSYLEGAHQLVRADEANVLLGGTSTHTPTCNGSTTSGTKTFSIEEIKLDQGGKSPYTSQDYLDESMISVTATYDSTTGVCNYTYGIYLTDGVWHIGSKSGTNITYVSEADVNANAVGNGS